MSEVSGETYEDLWENAPCGLLSTTPDGVIRAINETLLGTLGFSRAELVGRVAFSELLTIPYRIYFETHYAPLLRMQGFVSEIAAELVDRGGRRLPVFLSSTEKRGADGEPLLIRTMVIVAEQRSRYERELLLARRTAEQALRAKADFLAMFAHEIRNPLSVVSLQVVLLERKNPDPELKTPLARLRSSVDRVLNLLNNMLEISRVDAGKMSLLESAFAIWEVMQAVIHTFGPLAEKKSLPLHLAVDPKLTVRVIGDPVKLDQALTNLLGNAIKFTEKGSVTIGAETLRSSREAVEVRFWVRDTGIGIPHEQQAAIFEDYVQADAGIQKRFGGTGLGLSITRRLVELHGGKLQLQSHPNQGSTFSFELKFRLAPESPPPV